MDRPSGSDWWVLLKINKWKLGAITAKPLWSAGPNTTGIFILHKADCIAVKVKWNPAAAAAASWQFQP